MMPLSPACPSCRGLAAYVHRAVSAATAAAAAHAAEHPLAHPIAQPTEEPALSRFVACVCSNVIMTVYAVYQEHVGACTSSLA